MKFALWLLALFAVATAAALFGGDNSGVVSVFVAPHRLDVSINLAVLVILGFTLLMHLALLSLRALLRLPQAAREWRSRQRERSAVQALANGTAHFLAGRFTRTLRDAQLAVTQAQAYQHDPFDNLHDHSHDVPHPVLPLAHWLAAEANHALLNRAQRDAQLQSAVSASVGTACAGALREGLGLRSARFALDDRDPKGALRQLQQLSPGVRRRTAALRLQLRAARMGNSPAQALEVARSLAKHGAFSADTALSLRRSLSIDCLKQSQDPAQLMLAWKSLDSSEQAMPEVSAAAADRLRHVCTSHNLAQHTWQRTAQEWLLPPLTRWADLSPDQRLKLARVLPWAVEPGADSTVQTKRGDWLAQLEALQRIHPNDAALNFMAGMVFMDRQLWGKAQRALTQATQAAPALGDRDLSRQAWLALLSLAEQRGDTAGAQTALQRAATG